MQSTISFSPVRRNLRELSNNAIEAKNYFAFSANEFTAGNRHVEEQSSDTSTSCLV